jgi:uncharacterized protein YprB with RNaseH-like and TPR domain
MRAIKNMALIFDIETIGVDFDGLDEMTKKNLTHWIEKEADDEDKYKNMLKDMKDGLGFSPLTGEIAAIGIYNTDRGAGVVYFRAPGEQIDEFTEGNFLFKPMTEEEMLRNFWEGAKNYNEFISFNGRGFDAPFLMVRSALYKIKPTKDLMSNRYLTSQRFDAKHIDLLDQLSFYGAVRHKRSLHLYCYALGIKSPKTEGITGDDVARLFKEKKYIEIARYNSWDLTATKELYDIWKNYIKF